MLSDLAKILGFVRGLAVPDYAEGAAGDKIAMNNRGELIVAQGLPELAEIVRLGDSWQIASTTGQAALTALPTTTSGLSIKNNEASDGKCLIIDSFGSWEAVVDATQTDVTALFAMLNGRTDASPSAGTAETGFRSLSGRVAAAGTVTALRGATVVNNGWFPHSSIGAQMAAAVAGANWKINEALVRGMYIVPPGGAFSIQTVKAAAAAAAQQFFFIRYHMARLKYVN